MLVLPLAYVFTVLATIVHEIGHAIVGRLCGLTIRTIQIGTPTRKRPNPWLSYHVRGVAFLVFFPPSKAETIEAPIVAPDPWTIRMYALGGVIANFLAGSACGVGADLVIVDHLNTIELALQWGVVSPAAALWGGLAVLFGLAACAQFIGLGNLWCSSRLLSDGFAVWRPLRYHQLRIERRRAGEATRCGAAQGVSQSIRPCG